MAKPTALTGWWLLVLNERCQGSVALFASMADITTRTLNRIAKREIRLPNREHRIKLRKVAGERLLNHPDCPKYLRKKAKKA